MGCRLAAYIKGQNSKHKKHNKQRAEKLGYYVMTDGNGTFITLDKSTNKYVPIKGEKYAFKWDDRQKAVNIHKSSLSKKIRPMYSVEYRNDSDAIVNKKNLEQQSQITSAKFEGNAIDKLESMLQSVVAIIGGVDERFDELCDKLSEVDKKIVDIEHYIEFGKFNCYQGWICFKILQNLLQQRRQYKNEMEVINKIRCCKIESKEVDILKASIEQIKFKKYTPRAFKELFNGYCNQVSE